MIMLVLIIAVLIIIMFGPLLFWVSLHNYNEIQRINKNVDRLAELMELKNRLRILDDEEKRSGLAI